MMTKSVISLIVIVFTYIQIINAAPIGITAGIGLNAGPGNFGPSAQLAAHGLVPYGSSGFGYAYGAYGGYPFGGTSILPGAGYSYSPAAFAGPGYGYGGVGFPGAGYPGYGFGGIGYRGF